MYCKNCGHEIPEGAKFCRTCGTPVVVTSEKPETAVKQTSVAPRENLEAVKTAASERAAQVSEQVGAAKEKVKQNLDKEATLGKFLRLYFVKPQEAIALALEKKDMVSATVSLVIELLIPLLGSVVLAATVVHEFEGWVSFGDIFGPVFGLLLLTTLFLLATPFLSFFLLSKMNKTGLGAKDAYIDATTGNLQLFIFLLVAGLFSMLSVKLAAVVLVVGLVARSLQLVATYDAFAGGYLTSASKLWALVGTVCVMGAVYAGILYTIIDNVGSGILDYLF